MLKRVAVIFDNTFRPETTGFYCHRALSKVVAVEHILPQDLDSVETNRFDAFVYIDDGMSGDISQRLRPSAWWAIDTHLSFDRCLTKARQCDLTFSAQRDGVELFERSGIAATWLPLACDPDLHQLQSREKMLDWCFVGHLFAGARMELIELLQSRFPSHFVGQRFFNQMAETYATSKLIFNQSIRNDLNMRVFEALASGSLLITNDLTDNGLQEIFQNEKHLATFRDPEDLIDNVRYYLANEVARERIAKQGQAEVVAKHTYRHRMEAILSALNGITAKSQHPSTQIPKKDVTYFEWDRPDVLEMVPSSARKVADLGCGGGRVGELLKTRQLVEVWGVERDPDAAERASQRLDHVLTANLDDHSWSLPERQFDAIICADVLEHLRHPEKLLRRCHDWLTTSGCVIASLPNLQHFSVVSGLLEGNFTYEPSGLLDEDHVRLFTRREIDKLFFRASFQIVEWHVIPGAGYAEWNASGRSGEVRLGGLQITGLSPKQAEEFFAYQYILRAEPLQRPDFGLTSIVIVTHNQLNYTRRCIESLRFHTKEPFELIAVDNASTDGTADYFRAQLDVTLIVNSTNRGFPSAANQGIRVAKGRQVLLLNNDTLLTTGWLQRMLAALHSDPQIGLVGPVSNSVSGPQEIPVEFRDLASMDGFAWEQGRRHAGERIDLERLVGFCLLIRREVIDEIGLLDERFGMGNFEDDDYCRRTRLAGYRTVVARDCYVHHFGSRTFAASGINFAQLLHDNERKFRDKWRECDGALDSSPPKEAFAINEAEGGGLLLSPVQRPKLSLCMIVRNNQQTIGPCLESIRPWVDEMIVVDTGSTDNTPQICSKLGAKVFHWPWRDDFSAARNESLKYATSEWIFWMDSDDTVSVECGRKLRALAEGEHQSNVLGYIIQVHCPGPDGDQRDVTAVDHVKLIRNRQDLRFEHRIHEQILPAIRRAQGEVVFTDLYVVHSGADHTSHGRQKKLERDFKLLHLDLAERPDHPFILFNLGMTHADADSHRQAVDWLTRCLQVSTPEESHVRKAYALLVSSLMRLGEQQQAQLVCRKARNLFPEDKELLFRHAMMAHELGHFDESVQFYLKVLEPETTDRHFASIDLGLAGFKARHNLALVLEEQGHFDLAEQQWRLILQDHTSYIPAQIGLVECLLRRGAFEEATERIDYLRGNKQSERHGIQLASRLAEFRQDLPVAIHELEVGLKANRDDPNLLRELARLLHTNGNYSGALENLERLSTLLPEDTTAWHNRGVVLNRLGRHDEANVAFEHENVVKRSRRSSF